MRKRSWSWEQLECAVRDSTTMRQVLTRLNLRPAGGNYGQLRKYIRMAGLDTAHFTGQGWSRGKMCPRPPLRSLAEIMTEDSDYQSHSLKLRLFAANLKPRHCEECGWATMSEEGYLPLELDHINGNSRDNRLENLRVLCPNCHSLKPTHRARNLKRRPGGETGSHAALKRP
jgi:hypothetical protein